MESEYIKMLSTKYSTQSQYVCDMCSETVTNPICPECLAIEVQAWLTLYPDLEKTLVPRIKNYLINVDDRMPLEGTTCIKCTKNNAFVCTFCFTNYILRELSTLESNEIIIKEFLQFFNFDFEDGEFSQLAKELGVTY